MIKMIIKLDDNKIKSEKKYKDTSIYTTIDQAFNKMNITQTSNDKGRMTYSGNGSDKDFAHFGRMVNTLKKQEWFMDYAIEWKLLDNDDSDNLNDFNEEDLLAHYKKKLALGA